MTQEWYLNSPCDLWIGFHHNIPNFIFVNSDEDQIIFTPSLDQVKYQAAMLPRQNFVDDRPIREILKLWQLLQVLMLPVTTYSFVSEQSTMLHILRISSKATLKNPIHYLVRFIGLAKICVNQISTLKVSWRFGHFFEKTHHWNPQEPRT